MSIFNVELKKVVDDTYDIEIGYNLSDTLGISNPRKACSA